MAEMQPRHRRSSRERQPAVENGRPKANQKKKAGTLLALLLTLALLAILVAVSPKTPTGRAFFTTGDGENNLVDSSLEVTGSAYKGLRISEVMLSNQSKVPDENGRYGDWVEIWNSTDHTINLEHVGLSDSATKIKFLFPDVDIAPDARIIVFCDNTHIGIPGKTYHAKFQLSSAGETVHLYDPSAYTIDAVTCPMLAADESWALQDDGTWKIADDCSPGYANTPEGIEAYQKAIQVENGALIISEIMPDPITGLRDEDDELSDWVELYNTTDHIIYLSGYALSDRSDKPLKWHFPEDAAVPPHGYYIVFCSGKDRNNGASGIPHTNFKLNAEHDTVVLSDRYGNVVDRVIIDNIPEDCSYARGDDNTFHIQQIATPTISNDESGMNLMDQNLRAMNKTGVYITEVMASNDSVATINGAPYCDWIEIHNGSDQMVDLSGYGLSDNLGRPRRWQFPQGTTLYPGEYKLVFCDGDTSASELAALHTSFKIARAGGEIVCLSDPEGRVLDKLVMPLVPTNISYGRTDGLSGFFYYEKPTPMTGNGSDGFRGYTETPALTTAGGLYYQPTDTTIIIPEGTQVYYTLDGSIPTTASTPYQGESLTMNFTTVLRARAFSADEMIHPSDIVTATYFVNAYHTLPIVSLVTDPDELWNENDGMLTVGPDVDKSKGIPFKNTVYREYGKIPRLCHVEYYLLDGTTMISQDAEFSLQGQYSLDMPQKTFKLRAKSLYGTKTFAASLFNDRPYTEYKSFVLRNSGNDCAWTRLLDGFQSRLLDAYGTQVIHQAWNPCVVYLNGVYWGHYNMRERVDRFFIAQHEGLPLSEASKMDIVEGNGTAAYGSSKEYRAMIKKIKASDPAKKPEDLQYILDNVDVDNYLEYIALEMFVGNSDPGNIRYYRLHQPGSKWRWIFYDADYGLFSSSFDSPASYTKAKGMGAQKIDNTILLKLLTVPEYKDLFLTKLGSIFKTFTTDYMLAVLEPLVKQIEPEMNIHFTRWAEEHDQAIIAEWPTKVDSAYRYWEQRVNRLRNTCKLRPNYLWNFIRDAFNLTGEQMVHYFGERPAIPADATR